jgi:hypothetical protein
MALEGAGQGKLAELVADHVFRDVHRNVLLAVMHGNGQADEIRQNGGASRPGLDRTLVVGARDASTFFSRCWSTNGPFLTERAMLYPLFLVPALDDHAVRALVAAGR